MVVCLFVFVGLSLGVFVVGADFGLFSMFWWAVVVGWVWGLLFGVI